MTVPSISFKGGEKRSIPPIFLPPPFCQATVIYASLMAVLHWKTGQGHCNRTFIPPEPVVEAVRIPPVNQLGVGPYLCIFPAVVHPREDKGLATVHWERLTTRSRQPNDWDSVSGVRGNWRFSGSFVVVRGNWSGSHHPFDSCGTLWLSRRGRKYLVLHCAGGWGEPKHFSKTTLCNHFAFYLMPNDSFKPTWVARTPNTPNADNL